VRVVKIQPSAFIDNMWLVDRDDPADESYHPDTDTTETVVGTRLPYPFYAGEDGRVVGQWVFEGWRLIGFVDTPRTEGPVDLWWEAAFADPQKAIGMYLVTEDDKGAMATHTTAVADVEVLDLDVADEEDET
jgi:hypothetical protein